MVRSADSSIAVYGMSKWEEQMSNNITLSARLKTRTRYIHLLDVNDLHQKCW